MRALAFLLLALDVFLAVRLSRMADERAALVDRRAALESGAAAAEATRAERVRFEALLESYRDQARVRSSEELGIAGLREELLEAEEGLALARLSLEFRPEPEQVEGMVGSRVQASLRGSFPALYEYLARIESRRLPLAPAELTFREDAEGGVGLTVRWVAAWPAGEAEAARSLSASDVEQLSRWLERSAPPLGGGIFTAAAAPAPSLEPAPPPVLPEPAELEPPESAGPVRPALVGFVLARPELEPDVDRRVLAAIRHDGELHLAKVGDELGGFRIEAVDGRESVTLTDLSTGERIVLRL